MWAGAAATGDYGCEPTGETRSFKFDKGKDSRNLSCPHANLRGVDAVLPIERKVTSHLSVPSLDESLGPRRNYLGWRSVTWLEESR